MPMFAAHSVQESLVSKEVVDHWVAESAKDTFEAKIKPFEKDIKMVGGTIEIAETDNPGKANIHLLNLPKDLVEKIDQALK